MNRCWWKKEAYTHFNCVRNEKHIFLHCWYAASALWVESANKKRNKRQNEVTHCKHLCESWKQSNTFLTNDMNGRDVSRDITLRWRVCRRTGKQNSIIIYPLTISFLVFAWIPLVSRSARPLVLCSSAHAHVGAYIQIRHRAATSSILRDRAAGRKWLLNNSQWASCLLCSGSD